VALRAGYMAKVAEAVNNTQQSETNRGSFGSLGGMGAGLGLRFTHFMLDYSLTPFGELGNTQTITVSSWFGGRTQKRDLDISVEPDTKTAPATKPVDDKTAPQQPELDVPLDHEDWWNHMR